MPAAEDLPAPLAELARIQALELSDRRWRSDLEEFLSAVERERWGEADEPVVSPPAPAPRRPRTATCGRRRTGHLGPPPARRPSGPPAPRWPQSCWSLSKEVDAIRTAGVPDDAIVDALHFNLVFNLVNRLANVFEWAWDSDEHLRPGAKVIHRTGYKLPGFVLR